MNPEHHKLEFVDDKDGREPCRDFLEGLEPPKRQALEQALLHILAREGLNVCKTEWGKALGGGLAEFRVRHTEAEIMRIARPDLIEKLAVAGKSVPNDEVSVLLRVFFHAHGDKVILLLGGHDKGKNPSKKRQKKEIEAARALLKQHKARLKAKGEAVPRQSFREYWREQRAAWRERWKPGP